MKVRRLAVAGFAALTLSAAPAAFAQDSPPSVAPTVVTTPAPTVRGVQLPRTGSDTMPVVFTGLGLAGAGTVLVLGARARRRNAGATA